MKENDKVKEVISLEAPISNNLDSISIVVEEKKPANMFPGWNEPTTSTSTQFTPQKCDKEKAWAQEMEELRATFPPTLEEPSNPEVTAESALTSVTKPKLKEKQHVETPDDFHYFYQCTFPFFPSKFI